MELFVTKIGNSRVLLLIVFIVNFGLIVTGLVRSDSKMLSFPSGIYMFKVSKKKNTRAISQIYSKLTL